MNNNQNRRPPSGGRSNAPRGKDPRQGDPRRRANTPPQRRPLTPEEEARRAEYIKRRRAAEEKRRRAELAEQRRIEHENAMRKKQRKEDLKIFGGRLLVFLAIFIILCVAVALIFVIHFNHTPSAPDEIGKVTFYYGGAKTRTAPADEVVSGTAVYVCMNDLAPYLGMAQSGTAEDMRFIMKDSSRPADNASGSGFEEIAIFHSSSSRVTLGGQTIILDAPNVQRGDLIWVSSEFITEYMTNLSFEYNEKSSEVHVAKVKDEENSTDKETVYLPVSFKLKSAPAIPPIDNPDVSEHETPPPETEPPVEDPTYELNFKTDLSEYEKYMDPEDRDAYLILVNTKNHLSESDVPPDLTAPRYRNWENKTLRLYAARALEALFLEFDAAGFTNSSLAIRSTYREYANQAYLFEYYTQRELSRNPSLTREEAEKIVLTFSTRPGTSEHQSGLAVDMDTTGTLVTDFQYTEEYKWLSENAWKFGFILRFPDGKTPITTIQFEPWHYRFVGRYHAKKIYDSGLCLEEYLEQIGMDNNY